MAALLEDVTPLQLGAEGVWRGSALRRGRPAAGALGRRTLERVVLRVRRRPRRLAGRGGRRVRGLASRRRCRSRCRRGRASGRGRAVTLGGVAYEVTDRREAEVIGGEGELPFRVDAGWKTATADLRTTDRALRHARLQRGAAAPVRGRGRGARDARPARTARARRVALTPPAPPAVASLACSGCGAPLSIRAPGRSLVVACGALRGRARRPERRPPGHRALRGQAHRHAANPARLARHASRARRGRSSATWPGAPRSPGVTYTWFEHLLHNPTGGFRWLVEYGGHWTLSKTASAVPSSRAGHRSSTSASATATSRPPRAEIAACRRRVSLAGAGGGQGRRSRTTSTRR